MKKMTDTIYLKVYGKTYPLSKEFVAKSKYLQTATSSRWLKRNIITLELDESVKDGFEYVYNRLRNWEPVIYEKELLQIVIVANYLDVDVVKQDVNKYILETVEQLSMETLMTLYSNLYNFPWLNDVVKAAVLRRSYSHDKIPKKLHDELKTIGTKNLTSRPVKTTTTDYDGNNYIYVEFTPIKFHLIMTHPQPSRGDEPGRVNILMLIRTLKGLDIRIPWRPSETSRSNYWAILEGAEVNFQRDKNYQLDHYIGETSDGKLVILPKQPFQYHKMEKDFVYTKHFVYLAPNVIYVYNGKLKDNVKIR